MEKPEERMRESEAELLALLKVNESKKDELHDLAVKAENIWVEKIKRELLQRGLGFDAVALVGGFLIYLVMQNQGSMFALVAALAAVGGLFIWYFLLRLITQMLYKLRPSQRTKQSDNER